MIEPLIRLTWNGRETVETISTLLDQAEQIEIALPSNYNNALFCALYPDAAVSQFEDIDVLAGPELLADVATIRGLEGFAALIEMLAIARATVHVVSPPTIIIRLPSPTSEKA